MEILAFKDVTLGAIAPLASAVLMALVLLWNSLFQRNAGQSWLVFKVLSLLALIFAALASVTGPQPSLMPGYIEESSPGLLMAVLVQFLAVVIGGFSETYLQGEAGQARFVAALAAVLCAVQVLLMAGHWVVLVAAWAAVGAALQHMLCFYPERPFARLAAHKKQIADRLADVLLICAALLAWREVGSGGFGALTSHIAQHGLSTPLQWSAVALVGAVILRSAQFPIHGWLIQVMEAPTPVSALLHAGVVNLGGFVLIRFSPMLEHATAARLLLLLTGLATAVLAGLVTLTRISIKVKLAWSTTAQMGFMLVECALGLYTLAALHLIGHSLYKAHAFLAASSVLRQTRLDDFHQSVPMRTRSLYYAPVLAIMLVATLVWCSGHASWPWWWTAILGLAWAPLLWLPSAAEGVAPVGRQIMTRIAMVAGLTIALIVLHRLPLGIVDTPRELLGLIALAGMALLYLLLALLQARPTLLSGLRRYCYAGFYVDEVFTRLTMQIWPADLMKRNFS